MARQKLRALGYELIGMLPPELDLNDNMDVEPGGMKVKGPERVAFEKVTPVGKHSASI